VAGEINGHSIDLDVTDLDSARAAVAEIEGLAILVNNAGTDEFGFFPQTSPAQWQRVIDINLNGVINCTAAALPGMQEAGYGRIVNISSEAGRVGSKGSAVYSAAKAGVIGFTKVIARENGRPDRDPAADGRQRAGGGGRAADRQHALVDPARPPRPALRGRRRRGLPRLR
jgi:2-hydroxycyclohexanecarboxyl-CoA dehydrogenase